MTDDQQRPKLPDDAEGRSWVMAFSDVKADIPERRVIATLIAADDDLQLHVLGTAFVVGSSGNQALCMCAAHSLEAVKKFENAHQPRSGWNPPPDLVLSAPQYLTPDRIKAIFLIGGEAVTCDVDQLNYIDANDIDGNVIPEAKGNDIALITVVAPDGRDLFHERLALNFAVPRIGTEVAVLANDITHTPQEGQQGQIGLRFQVRHGIVTKIEFGTEEMLRGQSSLFYTTTPVPGGMSGSPVLASPALGAPMTVCGIVSSDRSLEEANDSFLVPGESAISMLWPSYGLGINVRKDDSIAPVYYSVADLVRIGFLDDRTSAARLHIQQSKQVTRILYEDAVHGRVLLQTTGHPNARD